MNKYLTLRELNSLEEGDWVWVIDLTTNTGSYKQVNDVCKEEEWIWFEEDCYASHYSDYNKGWIAYKNKEFAEAKGEFVELPFYRGQSVYKVEWLFTGHEKLAYKVTECWVKHGHVFVDLERHNGATTITNYDATKNAYNFIFDQDAADAEVARLEKKQH